MATSIRTKRLLNEIKDLKECRPVNEDKWDVLEAKIAGPEGTPYENGTFMLRIEIPERYPFEPPRVRFVTKIYHPNIDKDGRICLEILKTTAETAWKATFDIRIVLSAIKQLMSEPNPDDPLELDVAEELLLDKDRFTATARRWTEEYAMGESGSSKAEEHTKSEAASTTSQASATDTSQSNDSKTGSGGIKKQFSLFSSKAMGGSSQVNEKVSPPAAESQEITVITPMKSSATTSSQASNAGAFTTPKNASSLCTPKSSNASARSTPVSNASSSSEKKSAEKDSRPKMETPKQKIKEEKKKPPSNEGKRKDAAAGNERKKIRYEELFLDDDDDFVL